MSNSTDIFELIDSGNIRTIEKFIKLNPDDMNERKLICQFLLNPLQYASMKGKIRIVKLFISNGASVDQSCHYDHTPLHFAALFGHYNIVNYLIRNNANVNVKNYAGLSPLTYALTYGNEHGINQALNNKLYRIELKYELNELHLNNSYKRSYNKTIKTLINNGAVASQDDLYIAASCGGSYPIKNILSLKNCYPYNLTRNFKIDLIELIEKFIDLDLLRCFTSHELIDPDEAIDLFKKREALEKIVNTFFNIPSSNHFIIDYISSHIDKKDIKQILTSYVK